MIDSATDHAAPAEGVHSPGGIRFFDLRDPETGTLRRIFLAVPPGPAPSGGWPWLVLLDGNAVIATAADILRAQAPYPGATNLGWGIVIGLGYPTEEAYDPVQRSWDLSPPPGRAYPPFHPGGPVVRTGGAAEFARLLMDLALPEVARRLPLAAGQGAIFGHSFGGLFVLWLMTQRPDAFRRWIAVSPSITWEDDTLAPSLDRFDPALLRGELYLSAGEWEGAEPAPFQCAGPEAETRRAALRAERTVAAAEALAARLKPDLGNRVRFELFSNATHMSVLPVALNRGLHIAFGLWREGQLSG